MKKKSILISIIILICIFSLSSCGKSNKKESTTTSFVSETSKIKLLGISLENIENQYTYVGKAYDHSNVKVYASYSDGSSKDVTEEASFSGVNTLTSGSKSVTVAYGGKTATFMVSVYNLDSQRMSIDYTNAKTIYKLDENLDTKGLVVKIYYQENYYDIIKNYDVKLYDLNDNVVSTFTTQGYYKVMISYAKFESFYEVYAYNDSYKFKETYDVKSFTSLELDNTFTFSDYNRTLFYDSYTSLQVYGTNSNIGLNDTSYEKSLFIRDTNSKIIINPKNSVLVKVIYNKNSNGLSINGKEIPFDHNEDYAYSILSLASGKYEFISTNVSEIYSIEFYYSFDKVLPKDAILDNIICQDMNGQEIEYIFDDNDTYLFNSVKNSNDKISFLFTTKNVNSVKINDQAYQNGTYINLNEGENTIKLTISNDEFSHDYYLIITRRPLSSISTLDNIDIYIGDDLTRIIPNNDTNIYELNNVTADTLSIDILVHPTDYSSSASYKYLSSGFNKIGYDIKKTIEFPYDNKEEYTFEIQILVKSESGLETTYIITGKRDKVLADEGYDIKYLDISSKTKKEYKSSFNKDEIIVYGVNDTMRFIIDNKDYKIDLYDSFGENVDNFTYSGTYIVEITYIGNNTIINNKLDYNVEFDNGYVALSFRYLCDSYEPYIITYEVLRGQMLNPSDYVKLDSTKEFCGLSSFDFSDIKTSSVINLYYKDKTEDINVYFLDENYYCLYSYTITDNNKLVYPTIEYSQSFITWSLKEGSEITGTTYVYIKNANEMPDFLSASFDPVSSTQAKVLLPTYLDLELYSLALNISHNNVAIFTVTSINDVINGLKVKEYYGIEGYIVYKDNNDNYYKYYVLNNLEFDLDIKKTYGINSLKVSLGEEQLTYSYDLDHTYTILKVIPYSLGLLNISIVPSDVDVRCQINGIDDFNANIDVSRLSSTLTYKIKIFDDDNYKIYDLIIEKDNPSSALDINGINLYSNDNLLTYTYTSDTHLYTIDNILSYEVKDLRFEFDTSLYSKLYYKVNDEYILINNINNFIYKLEDTKEELSFKIFFKLEAENLNSITFIFEGKRYEYNPDIYLTNISINDVELASFKEYIYTYDLGYIYDSSITLKGSIDNTSARIIIDNNTYYNSFTYTLPLVVGVNKTISIKIALDDLYVVYNFDVIRSNKDNINLLFVNNINDSFNNIEFDFTKDINPINYLFTIDGYFPLGFSIGVDKWRYLDDLSEITIFYEKVDSLYEILAYVDSNYKYIDHIKLLHGNEVVIPSNAKDYLSNNIGYMFNITEGTNLNESGYDVARKPEPSTTLKSSITVLEDYSLDIKIANYMDIAPSYINITVDFGYKKTKLTSLNQNIGGFVGSTKGNISGYIIYIRDNIYYIVNIECKEICL